jgi:hypothetical protein
LAKTRQQLETQGYCDFFYFGHRYLAFWLCSLIILLATAFFAYGPLLDHAFKPGWSTDFQCHGKSCFWVELGAWAMAFFLTLPVWLKFPATLFFGSGSLAGSIQRTSRAFDRRPDVAVGPQGVYFPGVFRYQSLAWNDISKITLERVRAKRSLIATSTIKLFGNLPPENPQFKPVWPVTEPLLCNIPASFGFDQRLLLEAIRKHAPGIAVSETEVSL